MQYQSKYYKILHRKIKRSEIKFRWNQKKTQVRQINLEQKEQFWGIVIIEFKTNCRAVEIRTIWHCTEADIQNNE